MGGSGGGGSGGGGGDGGLGGEGFAAVMERRDGLYQSTICDDRSDMDADTPIYWSRHSDHVREEVVAFSSSSHDRCIA